MTPLRQRMTNDLTVRGLSENTQKTHLGAVAALALHYHRSPDTISAKEIQDYLIFLHEKRHLSWKSCNTHPHGLRFFYRITLQLPDAHFYLPGAKEASKLPQILNDEELVRLFTVSTNPKHRAVTHDGLRGRSSRQRAVPLETRRHRFKTHAAAYRPG